MNYYGPIVELGPFSTLSKVARFLGERPLVTWHRVQNGEFKAVRNTKNGLPISCLGSGLIRYRPNELQNEGRLVLFIVLF